MIEPSTDALPVSRKSYDQCRRSCSSVLASSPFWRSPPWRPRRMQAQVACNSVQVSAPRARAPSP